MVQLSECKDCLLQMKFDWVLRSSRVSRCAVTLGLIGIIAWLSLLPGTPRPDDSSFLWLVAITPSIVQKVLHIIAYGMLAVSTMWTMDDIFRFSTRVALILITTTAFGALLEWQQISVPGRYGSMFDILINAVGAILGIMAARHFLQADR